VRPDFTVVDSFDALVFGYIKGASLSTKSLSNGIPFDSRSFLTEFSDLS
jgi:hypothetical protein